MIVILALSSIISYRNNMHDKKTIPLLVLSGLALLAASCTSDPEGPVSVQFLDSLYGLEPGDVIRYVEPVEGVTFGVPVSVGDSPLLGLGEDRGIGFESILIQFDMTLADEDVGKVIESASLHLPVRVAPEGTIIETDVDTIIIPYTLDISFYELLEGFDEEDSLIVFPLIDWTPLPDSTGAGIRHLSLEETEFYLDKEIVEQWIDGEHLGILVNLEGIPEEPGLIEMNAHEYGSDPPAIRVMFTDSSTAAFASINDYSVISFEEEGLNCVGGYATRIHFDFTLGGVDTTATVHSANLVLTLKGEEGFGATIGEIGILDILSEFLYYLYTPDSDDPSDPGFLEGTGVDRNAFNAAETQTLRLPLRGFIPDVIAGKRINTGLILQSDLENVRVQRAAFYTSSADSLYRPYIEVIYSLPIEIMGE
jgi:hypothetical protein